MERTIAAHLLSGRTTRAAFGLVLIALTITAVAALETIRSAASSGWSVDRTLAVERELASLSASIGEAEAAYLEFVVTGQDDSLRGLESTQVMATNHLGRVETLTRDNPSQQRRVAALRTAIDETLRFAAAVVAKRRSDSLEAAGLLVRASANPGTARHRNVIRSLIDQMTGEEERLLLERTHQASAATPPAPALGLALCLFALLAILVGSLLLRDEARTRRTALEHVQNSERTLSATLDRIGDAVIATDVSDRIVRMNPVAEHLTGWGAGDAIGRPLGEVFNTHDDPTPLSEVDDPSAPRTGQDRGAPEPARRAVLFRKDGTERPIATREAPIRGADAAPRGRVLIFYELLAEREAQLASRRSQERFAKVAQSGIVAIVGADVGGHITEA